MAFDDDAKVVRDQIDLIHKVNTAIAEAVLRVAEETGTPPAQLAQMVQMGGGGIHSLFQPLIMRHHEEQQRRFMQAQRGESQPE